MSFKELLNDFQAEGAQPAIVHLHGAVNKRMLREVIQTLSYSPNELVVRITSHGGDPDIALAIAGLLRTHPSVVTEVFGQCYSAAVLIFAAAPRRRMQKWGWCMVHESSEEIEGPATTLKHAARHLERNEAHWNAIMAECTGTDAKVWEKLNERDTYLTADECLKLNLATEIF